MLPPGHYQQDQVAHPPDKVTGTDRSITLWKAMQGSVIGLVDI
jgi:hypothetical protein